MASQVKVSMLLGFLAPHRLIGVAAVTREIAAREAALMALMALLSKELSSWLW